MTGAAPTLMLIYATYPHLQQAEDAAKKAVEHRLAACAMVLGQGTSFYMWEGKMEKEAEIVVLFKTTLAQKTPLMAWLGENHSYDTPCVLALPITEALPPYIAWVNSVVARPG